jgi:hypothetical protein
VQPFTLTNPGRSDPAKTVRRCLRGAADNMTLQNSSSPLPIYPDNYRGTKLKIKRPFFVINNGGGGAYSYAMMNDT